MILSATTSVAEVEAFSWRLVIRRWYLSLSNNSLLSQIPQTFWKWAFCISSGLYSPIYSDHKWGCYPISMHYASVVVLRVFGKQTFDFHISCSDAGIPGIEGDRLWNVKIGWFKWEYPAPPGMRNRPWGLGVACLHGIWSNPLESSFILRLPHPSAFIHETPGKSVRVMPAEWSNEAGFSFAEGFRSWNCIN